MGLNPDAARPAREPQDPGQNLLAAIVSASPDAIVVFDSDGRVVYANPSYVQLTGVPVESLLGRHALEWIPERHRHTIRTYWADVLAGKSELIQNVAFRADGSEVEVEVKATVLELEGKQYQIGAIRDVTERQRQARRAAALAQASASVATSESIDAALDSISECVLAGTRALAAWVMLDAEDEGVARVGAAGLPKGFQEHLRSAPLQTVVRSIYQGALAGRRVAVYADWRQQAERVLGTNCPLSSLPWQTAAIAGLTNQGASGGMLTALYRDGEIPYAAGTAFLTALADQAATAAANARLLVAAREKVMLEERQRLSRELHDSVSQSLYAIQLEAQAALDRIEGDPAGAAQPIDQIRRLTEASQAEMRALIFELRPEALEREGLVAALSRQVDAFRARSVAARLVAGAEPALHLEVKRALQAISHQALCNTGKHARASHVDVRLGTNADAVVLEIADDGVGFDPNGSFPGRLGLRSMHERAAGVGGSLAVVSAPGRGTRITVTVEAASQPAL